MLTDQELKRAKRKYKSQIFNVEGKKRVDTNGNPIEMRLTFEEWLNIWLQSGHWHERGAYKGQYVMSRIGDLGHYEIGNVEIKTAHENNIEKCNSLKLQKMYQDPMWQEKQKIGCQKRSQDPKWKEKTTLANQRKAQDPEWRKKVTLAGQKRSQDPKWQEKHKLNAQKNAQDPKWQENQKLGSQKANNKSISCDGVIYESRIQAGIAIAPEHIKTKDSWIGNQMKKFPDRFFYTAK